MKSKMFRKVLLIILICVLLVSSMGAYSGELQYEDLNIVELNGAGAKSIESAEALIIDYSDIEKAEYNIKNYIDAGKIVYVANPTVSAEELALQLNIPKDTTTKYSDAILVGYTIYKLGEDYIFHDHYVLFACELDLTEVNSQVSNNSESYEYVENLSQNNFDIVKTSQTFALANDISFQEERIKNANDVISNIENYSASDTDDIATYYFSKEINVYNYAGTTYLGVIHGVTEVRVKGYAYVDGEVQLLYDVISNIEVCPDDDEKVGSYKVKMHCNISGHQFIAATRLESEITYGSAIELTGSFSTSSAGGSVGYTSSWTHMHGAQEIINSIENGNTAVRVWTAEPLTRTDGDIYGIKPGIRVATTNGVGQRGAFTTMYTEGSIHMWSILEDSIEFGGWF